MVSNVKEHRKISSFSSRKATRKHAFQKNQEIPLSMSLFRKDRPFPLTPPYKDKSLINLHDFHKSFVQILFNWTSSIAKIGRVAIFEMLFHVADTGQAPTRF